MRDVETGTSVPFFCHCITVRVQQNGAARYGPEAKNGTTVTAQRQRIRNVRIPRKQRTRRNTAGYGKEHDPVRRLRPGMAKNRLSAGGKERPYTVKSAAKNGIKL